MGTTPPIELARRLVRQQPDRLDRFRPREQTERAFAPRGRLCAEQHRLLRRRIPDRQLQLRPLWQRAGIGQYAQNILCPQPIDQPIDQPIHRLVCLSSKGILLAGAQRLHDRCGQGHGLDAKPDIQLVQMRDQQSGQCRCIPHRAMHADADPSHRPIDPPQRRLQPAGSLAGPLQIPAEIRDHPFQGGPQALGRRQRLGKSQTRDMGRHRPVRRNRFFQTTEQLIQPQGQTTAKACHHRPASHPLQGTDTVQTKPFQQADDIAVQPQGRDRQSRQTIPQRPAILDKSHPLLTRLLAPAGQRPGCSRRRSQCRPRRKPGFTQPCQQIRQQRLRPAEQMRGPRDVDPESALPLGNARLGRRPGGIAAAPVRQICQTLAIGRVIGIAHDQILDQSMSVSQRHPGLQPRLLGGMIKRVNQTPAIDRDRGDQRALTRPV